MNKSLLSLMALLILFGVSQSLRINSHQQDDDDYKPVQDLTAPSFIYAVGQTMMANKELNSQSKLLNATYYVTSWNSTRYKINFDTNGNETSYEYSVQQENNWPQVMAAFKLVEKQYPVSNLYQPISYSTKGVKGENFTVIFEVYGVDRFSSFYLQVGVDAELVATQKLLLITCQSFYTKGCLDNRLALQVFKANNKFYQDHPLITEINYDLSRFHIVSVDEVALKVTIEQTFTPRESTDSVVKATLVVTTKTFDITYS